MEPSSAKATPTNTAAVYCDRALAMMRGLNVLPTPKNYALFFACVSGQPAELVKEIEHLVQSKQFLSEEVLDRCYQTHIADAQSRAVQETTVATKKLLAEMVANVSSFGGTTQNVSQQLTRQMAGMGDALNEDSITQMAKTVLQSAQTIKESSELVTERLATAQREIADLRENLAKATTESERDFLTGCYNRKAFDKRLQEAVDEAGDKESAMTLLMIDIDHFKRFNDTFGHLIGDEVLKIVARILTDSVKGMDTVARFGGEEFAVILPRTPIGGGMIVSETIRKLIASKELKNKSTGENYGQVTVSIGVGAFRHGIDVPTQLIKRADSALYRSKKAGRNRVTQENLSE